MNIGVLTLCVIHYIKHKNIINKYNERAIQTFLFTSLQMFNAPFVHGTHQFDSSVLPKQ